MARDLSRVSGGPRAADSGRRFAVRSLPEGGISNVTRTLLDEELAPGSGDTFEKVLEKCWREYEAELAAAAVTSLEADRRLIATVWGGAD